MGDEVRTLTGVPVAANFAHQRGSAPSSPIVINDATDTAYYLKSNVVTPLGNSEFVCVVLGDETTAITTGTAKVTCRLPFAGTLIEVSDSLTTSSSSGLWTLDINKNGTTVLSTKLTIDVGETTSSTAATPAVISVSAFAKYDELTFDFDVSGTGAKGPKAYLQFTRT